MTGALEQSMLAVLFDRSQPMTVSELHGELRCTRRDLWWAIRCQHNLGNIKRGEPVELTAAARVAIAAGRMTSTDWRIAA